MLYTVDMNRHAMGVIGVALVAFVIGGVVFFFYGEERPGALITSGLSAGVSLSGQEVPFAELGRGVQSAIVGPVNYHITSAKELSELWEEIGASSTPPAIDFSRQAVIAIFAGPEQGARVAVTKIADTAVRTVAITIALPQGVCAPQTGKPSIASSYELYTMPATTLPLTHTEATTTLPCAK